MQVTKDYDGNGNGIATFATRAEMEHFRDNVLLAGELIDSGFSMDLGFWFVWTPRKQGA